MARKAFYPRQARPDTVPERGPRPGKIRPYPAPNDNPPFKFRPKPNPGFPGKKVPGVPRRLPFPPMIPGLPFFPGVGDFLDNWDFYPNPQPWPVPQTGGWYLRQDCGRRPGSPPYFNPGGGNTYAGPYYSFGVSHVEGCIAGQVPSGTPSGRLDPYGPNVPNPPASRERYSIHDAQYTPALRFRHDLHYWRNAQSTPSTFKPPNYRPVSPNAPPYPGAPAPDPNWHRAQPASPPQVPKPTDWQPDPIPENGAPPDWHAEFGGQPTPRPKPHRSEPPPAGTQEKKVISKAAKIGIWLWHMMDTISELTEIGGALYEALPEEIRKKYDCGKGVNIGQYGSDINACMVKALSENWALLDGEEAFKNIAKNVVEDMTIGQFHKWLGKVTPPGISIEKTAITSFTSQLQVEMYIAGKLEELWDALGI